MKKKFLLAVLFFSIFPFLVAQEIDVAKEVDVVAQEVEAAKEEIESADNDGIDKKNKISFYDSKYRLRREKSEDGVLSVDGNENGIRTLITASDEEISLKKFDSSMRVVSEKIWRAAVGKTRPEKLCEEKKYKYNGAETEPSEIDIRLFEENKHVVSTFGEGGKLISKITYDVEEIEKELPAKEGELVQKKIVKKETVVEKQFCTYDEQDRLTRNRVLRKNYSIDKRYIYIEGFDFPNEKIYENGEMVREKKYSANTAYEETIYFAESMSVRAKYEDEKKVSEVVYIDGVETRRQTF